MVSLLHQIVSPDRPCTVHRKMGEFICEECQRYLCSDCLFAEFQNPVHSGHRLVRLCDILGRLKSDIVAALARLFSINEHIQSQASELRATASSACACAESELSLFRDLPETIERSISETFRAYQQSLESSVQNLNRIRDMVLSMDRAASVLSDPHKLMELTGTAQTLRREIDQSLRPIPRPSPQDAFIPAFVEFNFMFDNFPAMFEASGRPDGPTLVRSSIAVIYANTWQLTLSPRGPRDGQTTSVVLALEAVSGPAEPGMYDFCIELGCPNAGQEVVVWSGRAELVVGRPLRWDRDIAVEHVMKRGFLTDAGQLLVVLRLRPVSYYQAYVDTRRALAEERARLAQLREEVIHSSSQEQITRLVRPADTSGNTDKS
jgi:hypothetical protein